MKQRQRNRQLSFSPSLLLQMDGKRVRILHMSYLRYIHTHTRCYKFLFYIGVDFPIAIANHKIVASMDNQFLYTIGNSQSSNVNNRDIYKFSCLESINDCKWTKVETRLKYGRSFAAAMRIPKALAEKLCK